MSATKFAFTSVPLSALTTPTFLAGQEADDLEQSVGTKVRERAEMLFEQSGRVPGNDEANWLQAESEILRADVEIRESGTWVSVKAPMADCDGRGMQIVVRPKRVLGRAKKTESQPGAPPEPSETFFVASLPVEVDPRSGAASFRDHNLLLMIKKVHPARVIG